MAAPSYNSSSYSAPTSPPYTPSVTDGERILELRPSLTAMPSRLPGEYVFRTQRMTLDLGARIWPTCTPCYGYTGTVRGSISAATLEHVKSVKLTLEGFVNASFMERGVLAGHIESTLFKSSVTLYACSTQTFATNFPFSISIPATSDNDRGPLPPSFVYYLPGVSAEIRYRIRVDMHRSGLRRRESLIVPILYLPRSYAPSAPQSPLFENMTLFDNDGMKELYLTPKSTTRPVKNRSSTTCADVQAKIALPCPLVFASGERIPFVLTIRSNSPALAALYTNVTLQLVKVIRIKAYEKTSSKEISLAAGEVYDIEQQGDGVQVLRGELGNGAPGKELSWIAAEIAEIKHTLKLSIKPPSCTTALSSNIPMFEGALTVRIVTHRHAPEIDITTPALGLIGVNAA